MRTRRIAVNTAIYRRGTSGSSTATHALIDALRHLDNVEIYEVAPTRTRSASSVLNAIADARWDLWQAARTMPDIDLLVSPCNLGHRGPARKHLLVVYDVMVFDRPDLFDKKFATYFRLFVPASVRRADRILTMSRHAAGRLRQLAPKADIRVVNWPHDGVSQEPRSFPDRKTVLMVGATEPVKNQVAGIRAVADLRARTGADISLRVVGPAGRAEHDVRAALTEADPRADWSRREVDVPKAVLDAAYSSAWLLLQPSHEEGFGLPLLEAASQGLPVVHSGRGPMSEIAPEGDAHGIDAAAFVSAMLRLSDRTHWCRAAAASVTRARAFTPEAFDSAIRTVVEDLLPAAS